MKNIHLAIVFLLFTSFSFSQGLAIKFPVNNFIYAKIDNPIEIIGCANFDEIEATSQGATIKKNEAHKYSVRTEKPGTVYIDIYNKRTKITQSIPVRVLSLIPKVFLNHGGYLTKNAKRALKYSTGLKIAVFEPISLTLNGSVLFDLTVIHQNKVFRFKDQKQKFSENLKSLFQILEKDDLVVFNNIRLLSKNSEEILLDDLVYNIK